ASGGIFAIMTIALLLMPSATLQVAYVALFPLTLLLSVMSRPKYGLYWFVRGGELSLSALWCLLLIPFLELCYLLLSAGSWTHLGHLFGMLCGLGIVLLLPTRITMGQRSSLAAA
ncbi:MAG TPA: hypothetical protein VL096_21160, partial [Pirellulaceae bacterium]|nr:hypothetical protein [Pirellulaceae bacterium]